MTIYYVNSPGDGSETCVFCEVEDGPSPSLTLGPFMEELHGFYWSAIRAFLVYLAAVAPELECMGDIHIVDSHNDLHTPVPIQDYIDSIKVK